MINSENNIIILSLGGSLIVPENIDWKFLKNFRKLLINEIKKGKKFVIVTGGGYTAREYIQSAGKVTRVAKDDQDWLGIHATRMNAHLIKTIFREYAHPKINKNPRTKENVSKHFSKGEKIMVAAGWRPGWSTDYVSTILAQRLKVKTIINLSNINYVCDKDPRIFKNTKPIKETSWKNFRHIVGDKWDPGLNAPFDPIASKLADSLKLEVIIVNGRNLNNLKKCLDEKKFQGTVIR